MIPEEISNLYAFQCESVFNHLIDKGLMDKDLTGRSRNAFYDSLDKGKLQTSQKIRSHTEIIRRYMCGMIDEDKVSLTKLAKQYSEDSPRYIVQSWM